MLTSSSSPLTFPLLAWETATLVKSLISALSPLSGSTEERTISRMSLLNKEHQYQEHQKILINGRKKKGKRKKEERIEERHQLPLFYVRCYIGSYFKQRKLLCQLQFYIIIISRNRPFARKAGERAAVLAKRQPVAPSVLSLANSPGASLYLLSVLLVRPRGHAAGTGAQRAP